MLSDTVTLHVLGATATLRVAEATLTESTLDRIRLAWTVLEERFDRSGRQAELDLAVSPSSAWRANAGLRAAYGDAIRWRNDTAGYFSPHRADGGLDLDGLARAYAIRDAAEELTGVGMEFWLVELGGDAMSDALGGGGWTTSVPDPADDPWPLARVPLGGSWTAVATSRTNPLGVPGEFVQATVLGRDPVGVHALATAIVAGGSDAFELAVARWAVDVLAVDTAGDLRWTPRLARHLQPVLGHVSAR